MKKNMGYIVFNVIVITILLSLGTYGYLNKDTSTKETKKEVNTSTNTLSSEDKTYLKNVAVSIFNDSFEFLTFKSDESVIISEEGKITSAAKTMYLSGTLATTKKLTEDEKQMVVTNANTTFNSSVTFKDFTINYSNEYCGIGGYSSSKGTLDITDNTGSGKCSLPFMVFKIGDVKLTNDTYTVKVYNAFVEQEDITADKTCKQTEESYSKIIKAYGDYNKKDNIYNSKVVGCCTKGTCETAAIYGEKDKIMNVAEDNSSYYTLSFKKTNNNFTLEDIIKAEN